MSAYARWSLRDLGALAIGGVALAGAAGYLGSQARAAPSFTAGFAGGRGGTDAEFGRRIVSAFPAGSRGDQLVAELKRQGFTSTDWLAAEDVERVALRREAGQACAPVARIRWRTDPDGRVNAIRRTYRDEGCP